MPSGSRDPEFVMRPERFSEHLDGAEDVGDHLRDSSIFLILAVKLPVIS
jgi:hypothetical protein